MFGQRDRWPLVVADPVPGAAGGRVYVVCMYVRDSRTVGGAWATFLGGLRCTTYAHPGPGLPAAGLANVGEDRDPVQGRPAARCQRQHGTPSDDLPTEAMPVEKLLSRQDKVIRFLTDEQVNFLKRLQEKNPVTAYRFGDLGRDKVDEEFRTFDGGQLLRPRS